MAAELQQLVARFKLDSQPAPVATTAPSRKLGAARGSHNGKNGVRQFGK
jgi:hypothetical protein